jgi:hypothetical protein
VREGDDLKICQNMSDINNYNKLFLFPCIITEYKSTKQNHHTVYNRIRTFRQSCQFCWFLLIVYSKINPVPIPESEVLGDAMPSA